MLNSQSYMAVLKLLMNTEQKFKKKIFRKIIFIFLGGVHISVGQESNVTHLLRDVLFYGHVWAFYVAVTLLEYVNNGSNDT